MKARLPLIASAALAVALASCAVGTAGKSPASPSAELQKMKTLAGTWKGTMQMPNGPAPVTVKYRLIAGGTAVEERIFAGTPMEMVTMYADDAGKLALTHYCMLGNRPEMELVKATADSLSFILERDCEINTATEKHMHAATLAFKDANTLEHDWTLWDGGKEQPHHAFTLTRSKP